MPNDLIALIRQKKEAIAKLQAELGEAMAELSGPRPASVPKNSERRRSKVIPRRPSAQRVGAPGIVPTSSVGLAQDVIRLAGKPLHVQDIIHGIESRGHHVSKTTLVGNLSRYVKGRRVFYRSAPSVFGLIEMKKGA